MVTENYDGRPRPGRLQFETDMLACTTGLRKFAMYLTRDAAAADDLLQDTFLRALRKWHTFEPGTDIKPWLFTLMKRQRVNINRHTKSWRHGQLNDDHIRRLVDTATGPEAAVEAMQTLRRFAAVLCSLPTERRDIFIGCRYADMSYEQLALLFKCAFGTIQSRVHRTTRIIEHRLEDSFTYTFDLRPWATAARGIAASNPYYPIAKAYEEIYSFVQ